nr:glycoside hydrolase [Candidatus Sigynarchaeota archaeon]
MVEARVQVDPGKKIDGLQPFWRKVVGCGNAFLLTRKDMLDHVEDAVNTIGFEYLRFHGTLSDDVGLVQHAEKDSHEIDVDCLNFTNIDAIYDALLDIGIKPFVELSFMPEYLASTPGSNAFKYPSNNSPPANFNAWETLIYQIVMHWKDRYGLDEIQNWYFEIWNEPDLKNFWTGTMNDYFKLYQYSARAIKSVDKQLRIGGPATSDGKWITPFLRFCHDNSVPVDFITTHAYQGNHPLRGIKAVQNTYIHDLISRVRGEIGRTAFPFKELHVTEWGSSSNPFDEIHDTSNQAAFICNAITSVNSLVDSFSYWTVSDIFEELGLPDRAFHGGFGLISMQGIRKPSFLAFNFLKQLGDETYGVQQAKLPPGAGIHATGTGKDMQLLAWYYM